MYFVLPILRRALPGLNLRIHTLNDLYELARKLGLRVLTRKLIGVKSAIVNSAKGFIIYIDKSLTGVAWQFAVWHEIAHFLLHGSRCCDTEFLRPEKDEFEADAFALMAMLPLSKLSNFLYELSGHSGFISKLLKKRVYLLAHFGL